MDPVVLSSLGRLNAESGPSSTLERENRPVFLVQLQGCEDQTIRLAEAAAAPWLPFLFAQQPLGNRCRVKTVPKDLTATALAQEVDRSPLQRGGMALDCDEEGRHDQLGAEGKLDWRGLRRSEHGVAVAARVGPREAVAV